MRLHGTQSGIIVKSTISAEFPLIGKQKYHMYFYKSHRSLHTVAGIGAEDAKEGKEPSSFSLMEMLYSVVSTPFSGALRLTRSIFQADL